MRADSIENSRRTERTNGTLTNIEIPAQPVVVRELYRELRAPHPDLRKISKTISRDASLTGSVLKLANSPLFGVRKEIDSVSQALLSLGLDTIYQLVLTSALQKRLQGQEVRKDLFEKFWDHSMTVAALCEAIIRKGFAGVGLPGASQAYLAGLFHDCALPLFMMRYSDYPKIFDSVLHNQEGCIASEEWICETNHTVIGSLMARSWCLPDSVRYAIRHHHDRSPDMRGSVEGKKIWAVLILAEHLLASSQENSGEGPIKEMDRIWAECHRAALSELTLDLEDVARIRESGLEEIED